jgi:hypothetical protein
MQISPIRPTDKTDTPLLVASGALARSRTNETEVPVKVREWIEPPLLRPPCAPCAVTVVTATRSSCRARDTRLSSCPLGSSWRIRARCDSTTPPSPWCPVNSQGQRSHRTDHLNPSTKTLRRGAYAQAGHASRGSVPPPIRVAQQIEGIDRHCADACHSMLTVSLRLPRRDAFVPVVFHCSIEHCAKWV